MPFTRATAFPTVFPAKKHGAAKYDPESSTVCHSRKLLPVKEGKLGLQFHRLVDDRPGGGTEVGDLADGKAEHRRRHLGQVVVSKVNLQITGVDFAEDAAEK